MVKFVRRTDLLDWEVYLDNIYFGCFYKNSLAGIDSDKKWTFFVSGYGFYPIFCNTRMEGVSFALKMFGLVD